jgi:hypothetical protein
LERSYVNSGKGHVLTPTEVGLSATDYLLGEVPDFINVEFTRLMEEALDKIAAGELPWVSEVEAFYGKLLEWLAADATRVKRILDLLGTITQWKEPSYGKNDKIVWSDEAFYNEMRAAYERYCADPCIATAITKPQLATLIRMAISYRHLLSGLDEVIGPQPGGEDVTEIAALFETLATATLNDWERRFVSSLKVQYDTKGALSPKQAAILKKIAAGDAKTERPENEAAAQELLASLDSVTTWNPPIKRGKRTYDDKEFVDSLKSQLAEKHFLTVPQFEALKKLVRGYHEQIANYAALAAKFEIKEGAPRRAASTKKTTTKKRTTHKTK